MEVLGTVMGGVSALATVVFGLMSLARRRQARSDADAKPEVPAVGTAALFRGRAERRQRLSRGRPLAVGL